MRLFIYTWRWEFCILESIVRETVLKEKYLEQNNFIQSSLVSRDVGFRNPSLDLRLGTTNIIESLQSIQ
jgi:hypothetical protein